MGCCASAPAESDKRQTVDGSQGGAPQGPAPLCPKPPLHPGHLRHPTHPHGSRVSAAPANDAYPNPPHVKGPAVEQSLAQETRGAAEFPGLGPALPPSATQGGANASMHRVRVPNEARNILEDHLDIMHDGGELFAGRFVINDPLDRCVNEDSVVQFMHTPEGPSGHPARADFAVKFFLSRDEFEHEQAVLTSPAFASSANAVEVYPPSMPIMSSSKYILPPSTIRVRGETLPAWRGGLKEPLVPETFLRCLEGIAEALQRLHESGWVHRALTPSSILWLPAAQRWTLCGLRHAGRVGSGRRFFPTGYNYVAPEAVAVLTGHGTPVDAQPPLDIWALGVIMYELHTGQLVFGVRSTHGVVTSHLFSAQPLPWERHPLATDEVSVTLQHMLRRAPQERPTARSLYGASRNNTATNASSCYYAFSMPAEGTPGDTGTHSHTGDTTRVHSDLRVGAQHAYEADAPVNAAFQPQVDSLLPLQEEIEPPPGPPMPAVPRFGLPHEAPPSPPHVHAPRADRSPSPSVTQTSSGSIRGDQPQKGQTAAPDSPQPFVAVTSYSSQGDPQPPSPNATQPPPHIQPSRPLQPQRADSMTSATSFPLNAAVAQTESEPQASDTCESTPAIVRDGEWVVHSKRAPMHVQLNPPANSASSASSYTQHPSEFAPEAHTPTLKGQPSAAAAPHREGQLQAGGDPQPQATRRPLLAPEACVRQMLVTPAQAEHSKGGAPQGPPTALAPPSPRHHTANCAMSSAASDDSVPPFSVPESVDTALEDPRSVLAAVAAELDQMHAQGEPFQGRFSVGPPSERVWGRHGLLQFVTSRGNAADAFAVKFYPSRDAFLQEAAVYATVKPRNEIVDAVDCEASRSVGLDGWAFPSCVVRERGVNLREWVVHESCKEAAAVKVLLGVRQAAERLWELHAAGWVHRNLAPHKIIWNARRRSWSLTGFTCAAVAGSPQTYILPSAFHYLPPECLPVATHSVQPPAVLRAHKGLDVWTLAVIVYELHTRTEIFSPGTPNQAIARMLGGLAPLPWESPTTQPQHVLPLLKCLHRNPAVRGSLNDLFTAIDAIITHEALSARSICYAESRASGSSSVNNGHNVGERCTSMDDQGSPANISLSSPTTDADGKGMNSAHQPCAPVATAETAAVNNSPVTQGVCSTTHTTTTTSELPVSAPCWQRAAALSASSRGSNGCTLDQGDTCTGSLPTTQSQCTNADDGPSEVALHWVAAQPGEKEPRWHRFAGRGTYTYEGTDAPQRPSAPACAARAGVEGEGFAPVITPQPSRNLAQVYADIERSSLERKKLVAVASVKSPPQVVAQPAPQGRAEASTARAPGRRRRWWKR